jgi:hypothetical protein
MLTNEHALIKEATGVSDPDVLSQIAERMRDQRIDRRIDQLTKHFFIHLAKFAYSQLQQQASKLDPLPASGGPYGHELERGMEAQRQTIVNLRHALTSAQTALTTIHVEHRERVVIGPLNNEGFARVKMTSDHWPIASGWEALRRSAVDQIAFVLGENTSAKATPGSKP